nr:MAG TPA: hypothetical protein [Caudoviricetes sp.]
MSGNPDKCQKILIFARRSRIISKGTFEKKILKSNERSYIIRLEIGGQYICTKNILLK